MGVGPELRTDRLLLRGWRDADLEPYAALNADPVVMEHFPSTRTRAESEQEIELMQAQLGRDGFGLWAVEVIGVNPCIGFVGLNPVPFDAPFAPAVEVGWRLARDAWGHGYATESARAALSFGFDDAGMDEVVSFTVPANERSWRVMERIGMTRDPGGDFDHPRIPVGHPLRPHVLYRISRTTSEGSLSSRTPL